ncbi:DUF1191 domain-containing protein [Quillaja saponaria]|uniref:DUF1191 domain-containing protein n=1 Tax=Quillaja saponaria TaxID=32244 RepID=A0AAD7PNF2_QUISA|nr:DUF1191 domain-containing protein [Quillaja saponaria]
MGLLRSLAMLVLLIWFCWLPKLSAQSTTGSSRSSAHALDTLLQDYAYRAFVRPKTGIPYDGVVPSNLTGIKIAAMRLRSGSLRRKGVMMYKEFVIPTGLTERPYVERLVLVYQNLGNWSAELDLNASGDPILVKLQAVKSAPDGMIPKCVWFDLRGSVNFSNVATGNICSTIQQGHFSIVVKSPAPVSPTPPSGPPSPAPVSPTPTSGQGKNNNSKVGIIIGSVLGGLLLLVLSSLLILWVLKYKRKKKMQKMERAAEVGEALHMTSIGDTKAPAATGTRTQPTLEHEYAP